MKTFLFALMLMPSLAWSQMTFAPNTFNSESRNELDVRLITADYKYEEPGLMQIAGRMNGLSMDYRVPTYLGSSFLLMGGQYLTGTTYYDGTYQISGERTPTFEERDYNYSLKLGYGTRVVTAGQSIIDVSASFARRFHVNEGIHYDREQTYIYLPLELVMVFPVGTKSTIKFGVEQDVFLSGKNTTKVSQYYDENDRVYRQDSGSGSKFSLGYETSALGPVILAQVYVRRWDVADSSKVLASRKTDGAILLYNGRPARYYEPENNTKTVGFSLGSRF